MNTYVGLRGFTLLTNNLLCRTRFWAFKIAVPWTTAAVRFETRAMVYFCYIHRKTGGVPHFEVLAETSRDSAIIHAANLLAQRPDSLKAELWEDEALVVTVPPAGGPGLSPGPL